MTQRGIRSTHDMTGGVCNIGGCCHSYNLSIKSSWVGDTEQPRPLYDERALAEDLNSLTFQERQQMDEEIHGVAGEVKESPDFIAEKLQAMRALVPKLPGGQRKAYDRAAFLRPQLVANDSFHLMFLRAKRFDPQDAACLMAVYFQSKLELFGDDLLAQKITWSDLTHKEQENVKNGGFLHLKGNERKGRVILYVRVRTWDLADPLGLVRGTWYVNSAIEDDAEQQQRGAILMLDLKGQIKHSPMEIVKFFAMVQKHMETILFRVDSVHILYDNPALDNFFKSLFGVLRKDLRLRHRFHFGSTLEIQYSLRTFGINIEDYLGPEQDSCARENMVRYLEERLRVEEAWRQREEPFTRSTSKIALYPNQNDILLGRHKVAPTWPGNMMYNKLIDSQAPRYVLANGHARLEKTLIALQTIHVLHRDYGARFLTRKEDCWEAMEEAELQPKVSQSLRVAARGVNQH